MANFSAKDVKELRDITNIGMMDCKKALVEADGDKDKALKILKEKGLKVAAKRADKDASEGVVAIKAEGSKGAVIKLSCETDFVARNENFVELKNTLLAGYFEKGQAFLEEESTKTLITETTGKTGEKIELNDSAFYTTENGLIESYLHGNEKVGVLIELACDNSVASKEEVTLLAKDLCMQIAAMKPIAVSSDEVDEATKIEQKELFLKQMESDPKPDNIKEKIVEGKLNKYFTEICLLDMEFVKEAKVKIKDLLARVSKSVGSDITVKQFARMEIG